MSMLMHIVYVFMDPFSLSTCIEQKPLCIHRYLCVYMYAIVSRSGHQLQRNPALCLSLGKAIGRITSVSYRSCDGDILLIHNFVMCYHDGIYICIYRGGTCSVYVYVLRLCGSRLSNLRLRF